MKGNDFGLRKAVIEDAEAIAALSIQLGYQAIRSETADRLKRILQNADNCVYVTCKEDAVIGWIHGFYSLRVESPSFVEIGGLVVHEAYRNKGLGKLLINQVYEWGKAKGIDKIRVRSNVTRKETHQFYKNLGFEEVKEQKVFGKVLVSREP